MQGERLSQCRLRRRTLAMEKAEVITFPRTADHIGPAVLVRLRVFRPAAHWGYRGQTRSMCRSSFSAKTEDGILRYLPQTLHRATFLKI